MKKLLRYTLKTIAWILGIIVFLWIVLWAYVELNEAKLISKISSAIQEKTRGEVRIDGVSVSLIRTFPVLSLQLSGVVLRDSLYPVHKKDFLTASDIYLRISLRELLKGRSALGRITINNGSINLITDDAGRSNEYILSQQKMSESRAKSSVPVFILNNIAFHYENPQRKKLYQGTIRSLKCEINTSPKFVIINVNINSLINKFYFNTGKGSYIKNSNLKGSFQLYYNKKDHDLLVNHVLLNVGEQPFYFDGYFRIDKALSDFSLSISTNNIEFKKATSLLSDSLEARLAGYAFSKPVSAQVTVTGLTAPGNPPDVRIKMQVDMTTVKSAAGITSLECTRGTSDVDITIVSSGKAKDSLSGDLNGSIRLNNAEIKYVPRNFTLRECNGVIRFNNNDILIDSLMAIAGQTRMMLNGRTKNLITLGPDDPGKFTMYWKLSSPDLHIKDFRAFLSKGKFSAKQSNLDKLFSAGDVYLQVSAPKMDYNHFHASRVEGQVILQESGIQLQKIAFNHANGSMQISGEIQNGARTNPVSLHTKMNNMDIPLLFAAFDNFGQDAITKNNLKGTLTADILFKTAISNQAELSGGDSKGSVAFLLENGELNNFEPLIEVSKKAFRKQDFSEIKFATLKNKLDISGTTFIVNPMEIRSSAFTLFVEGVYDFKHGTDMSIQFPLRNLTKNQAGTDLSDDAKPKKGIGLRLRAKTGGDGKLKVTWDPFRKSIKNKDQTKDSLQIGTDKSSN
jgi:hypothetical protein